MRTSHVFGVLTSTVLTLVSRQALGVTGTMQIVAVNDAAIDPTDHVVIAPDDFVTVEFYLSGWNDDRDGSRLDTYQVAIDGRSSYRSGTVGQLEPRGWEIPWPRYCSQSGECVSERPVCSFLSQTCECVVDETCPQAYPSCVLGICQGPTHDESSGTFIDRARTDFVHFAMNPISAVRFAQRTLLPAWGSLAFVSPGPLDSGETHYLGTHILRASADACGTFTVAANSLETFVLLRVPGEPDPREFRLPMNAVTIEVDPGSACALAQLLTSSPIQPTRITRVRNNYLSLQFDKPVTPPMVGDLSIMELTEDVCAGSAGLDMSSKLDLEVSEAGGAGWLHIRDPIAGTYEHGKWYRIAQAGSWHGVEPFHVDVLAVIGDADGNGHVALLEVFDSLHRPAEIALPAEGVMGDVDGAVDRDLNMVAAAG